LAAQNGCLSADAIASLEDFELGYFVTPCDSKDLLEALDVEGFQSILQRSSRAYKLHSYTVGLA